MHIEEDKSQISVTNKLVGSILNLREGFCNWQLLSLLSGSGDSRG